MRKKYRTGPNLFFIEFIIALFFFLIVSTICVRVFVHAHLTTLNAEALSFAQTASSSVAEAIEASGGDEKALSGFFPQIRKEKSSFLISYDKNFQACAPEKAFYTLTFQINQENQMNKAEISVTDSRQHLVYRLFVRFCRPLTREEVLS